MSNLGQTFMPACWRGRPLQSLKSQGGFRKGRLGQTAWCLAMSWYQAGHPGFIPRGWGGSERERERGFFVSKMAYFLARQPWPVMPCRLSGQQPASQTQARWVSRLCVDRLPVVDWMKKPVNFEFLEKCQGDCVEISTVFINPDIYLGRETTIP